MNCKFCETENPDSAVYCKQCGKRIDGNTVCPVCHKLTPDAVFCTECGARLDGKTYAKNAEPGTKGVFAPLAARRRKKRTPP